MDKPELSVRGGRQDYEVQLSGSVLDKMRAHVEPSRDYQRDRAKHGRACWVSSMTLYDDADFDAAIAFLEMLRRETVGGPTGVGAFNVRRLLRAARDRITAVVSAREETK